MKRVIIIAYIKIILRFDETADIYLDTDSI